MCLLECMHVLYVFMCLRIVCLCVFMCLCIYIYITPKIHKRLYDVPGRPVISNCGTPTEKVSDVLDHHRKPVMQEGESYIKDTGDFLNKIKSINAILENVILVTADVIL